MNIELERTVKKWPWLNLRVSLNTAGETDESREKTYRITFDTIGISAYTFRLQVSLRCATTLRAYRVSPKDNACWLAFLRDAWFEFRSVRQTLSCFVDMWRRFVPWFFFFIISSVDALSQPSFLCRVNCAYKQIADIKRLQTQISVSTSLCVCSSSLQCART